MSSRSASFRQTTAPFITTPSANTLTSRTRTMAATRQHLSNTATRLFIERGFDHVTIANIAAAANVSKMTVFNYFPRKETLFFDRLDEIHQLLTEALALHPEQPPVAALRALAHALIEEAHPLTRTDESVSAFWRTVAAQLCHRAIRSPEIAAERHALRTDQRRTPRPYGFPDRHHCAGHLAYRIWRSTASAHIRRYCILATRISWPARSGLSSRRNSSRRDTLRLNQAA